MTNRSIEALFIDFDGTILDTETVEFRVWEEVYQYYGLELPLALWADSIGRGINDIKFDPYAYLEEQVSQPLEDAIVRVRRRERYYELVEAEPVRPGIIEYLQDARQIGLPVAVVSSSNHDWVDTHMKRLGLISEVAFTRCFGDVPLAKPHPDLYLSACETLGISPPMSATLEDSANGLLSAKRAGVFAIAFPNPLTALLDLSHADLRIDDLTKVPLESVLAQIAATRS